MQQTLIVGVDVSKLTLDIHIKPSGFWMQIPNQPQGFRLLLKELNKQLTAESRVIVVMEHTGKYSWRLETFLRSRSIDYCKVPALEIKRSQGMTRGKNDKIDAERIAAYGWLRRDELKADQPLAEGVRELQDLLRLRSKLVRDRSGYMCRLKEMKVSGEDIKGFASKIQRNLITMLSEHISSVDQEIRAIIDANSAIQKTCDLLRSIKGVGLIVAASMIGCTNNFSRFENARKFNCYAGLAPFDYLSGTSIRGKSRVSHLANKEVKTILTLAASTAIQHDAELKNYYKKRVANGKTKMNSLNVVRTKLVARMFAVIKRQSPYQEMVQAA